MLRPFWAALTVLLVGLAVTVVATLIQSHVNRNEAIRLFEAVSQRGADQVAARMLSYQYGLRGVRGSVLGAGGIDQMTRQRFADYSASRDIGREFPGALGFGILNRVTPQNEAAFLAAARKDGWPDFALRQFSPHPGERFVVQFIEPISRNRDSIGFDAASDRSRRDAALASMHSGLPVLTEPITLVQATGSPQRSFLLLLPIYRSGLPLGTKAERDSATTGWSFVPLVIDDVLSQIDMGGGEFNLALRDLGAAEGRNFFQSSEYERPAAADLSWRAELSVHGRRWLVQTRASQKFVDDLNQTNPVLVAVLGTGIAGLLAMLAAVLSQSNLRARSVREEQARRAAIVDNSTDAIIGESLDGLVTDWNSAAVQMFGYSAEDVLGRRMADLLLPEGFETEEARIRELMAQGERLGAIETQRRHADGGLVDVSLSATPIFDLHGVCTGFSTTLRDSSEPRRLRRELEALNAGLEQQVRERTLLLDSALHDLRAILDAVPSMIGYWDRQLVNRVANRAYGNFFGLEPHELAGRKMADVLDPDLFERNRVHAEAALKGERQTFERFFVKPDGGVQHSLAHYLPDVVEGEVRGFYVLVHDVSELTENRMRLAAAQRDNTALLHVLHHHASVLVTDAQGIILEVNDNFCRLSGFSREELLGQGARITNSGVHPPEFWAEMWRTISNGNPWRSEVCNLARDGSRYWVDCTISPYFGDDGQIERYISIRTDISARKSFEEALYVTNTRFEIASASAGIGVWEYRFDSARLSFDARMLEMYGLKADRADEDPYPKWKERLHRGDRRRIREAMADALERTGELDLEFRIVLDDGAIRHIRASGRVVRGSSGEPISITGVNLDVTERVMAEIELRETSSLLQTVLASAFGVAIIATDASQTIKVFNAGAERLLGYSASEVIGHAQLSLLHDPQELAARADEMARSLGRPVEGVQVLTDPAALEEPREWTYVTRDGRRPSVSLVVTAMREPGGELLGYVGIAHDVSRQKEYERSLHDAVQKANQASQAKSQFLANMSHEIRTPMNAILGMLTLVQRTQLTQRQLDYIRKTEAAAQSLLGLLNDILDFSKVEAGKMELDPRPFQLDGVLRNLAVIMSANVGSKDVEVLFDIDPELPLNVIGDDLRLQQILINLGGNSVKFTERGEVVVGVRCESRDARSTRVAFEVRDTGIGISPEQQQRIFSGFTQAEASTTRRFGGTGLGVAICQRLVALMGGELRVDSTLGKGSRFYFSLSFPLADPGDLPALPAPAPSRQRALVVDDHPTARALLQTMADSLDWQTDVASGGEEALAMLRAAQARGEQYGLVLVDWQMPGIDGWETCKRIRELEGNASVVVMVTAHGREALAERSEKDQQRIDGFLVKPITASMLQDMVADAGGVLPPTGWRAQLRLDGMRLLLAEDNPTNQQIALELLQAEGASVQVASNGAEAVSAVAAAAPQFDAVLMDLQMPEMDGFEATRRIRQRLSRMALPIIAMTANAMADDRQACLDAGMNDHVGKPFDLARLIDVLRRHTGRPDLRAPGPVAAPSLQVPAEWLEEAQSRGIELASALRRVGGKEAAYLRMLRAFLKESLGVPDQFEAQLAAAQFTQAARLMHTLKGVASTVGAAALANAASQAERLLGSRDVEPDAQALAACAIALRSAMGRADVDLSAVADRLQSLQPAAPAPASQDDANERERLRGELARLAGLLSEGDMAAMDLHAEIEAGAGPLLGQSGAALAEAMSRLDFDQALQICQQLAGQLQNSSEP